MKAIFIKASIKGSASSSSKMVDAIQKNWITQGHEVSAQYDLGSQPLPYFSAQNFTDANQQNIIINELKDCDYVVFGVPLYNLGIPAQLKTYMDYATRAGDTFKYTSEGVPVGLLNKKAIIAFSSGGSYEGAAEAYDLATKYMKTILAFLGFTEVTVVKAQLQAIEGLAQENLQKALADCELLQF